VQQASLTQGELFPVNGAEANAATGAAPAAPQLKWEAAYHLVDSPEKFKAFLKELKRQERFAIDLETTGLDPRGSEVVGYSFCWKAGEAWYLPVCGPQG